MLNKERFLYHTLFWTGIYLFWIVLFRSYTFPLTKTITIEFCYLIFITTDYYIISAIIVPEFLQKKKYILFIGASIFVTALSAFLRSIVSIQMNAHFFHGEIETDFMSLYVDSVINILFWVLLILSGKMILDRVQSQKQIEWLAREKTKNELDFLKAQINPHALFNSLNTIYGHIDKNNHTARNILVQFSELLRYQLYDCLSDKVSLEKEMEYIKNYMAFQQLRKDHNLVVTFESERIEKDLYIAPLMLVVLVENAFKFVSNISEGENSVVIRLYSEEGILYGSFFNTLEPEEFILSVNDKGIGINNLKRRLELLYPGKYTLTYNKENHFYETHITIELV
jgi:two-component system LytT family sensor kinase